jgi:short subunit dehydrogenase-like uncharacterized protein
MKIVVIGAYGYTGQLICNELVKANIDFDICGRSNEKLIDLAKTLYFNDSKINTGDIKQLDFVNHLMANYNLFINCAGPYNEESNLLLKNSATNSKVYIDLTGEVSFIKSSYEKYNALAKTHQATIIHGCAFESLPFDLMAQKYITKPVENMYTFYWFNKHLVSPGTRITMKLAQYYDLYRIEDYEWKLATKNDFCFTTSIDNEVYKTANYPLPEIAFFKWNYQPKSAQSFVFLPQSEVNYIGERKTQLKTKSDTYNRLKNRKKAGPNKTERENHHSKLTLKVTYTDQSDLTISMTNVDMYKTTAKGVKLTVEAILNSKVIDNGVINPAKLFKNKEIETLANLNFKLVDDKIEIKQC